MATRTWTGLGADGLWTTVGNWDGGVSIPTTGDDIIFNGSGNANMTGMVATRSMNSWTFTGYTGTFTLDFIATVSGSTFTLSSGMTLAGSGTVTGTGACTWTFAGKTVPNFNISGSSITHTLADACVVSGLTTLGGSGTTTVNGFSITCQGGLTVAGTTSNISGTTTITLAGTGTWTGPTTTGMLRLATTINTAGTITLSGQVGIGGSLTYVAGTVVTTGSTLYITLGGSTLDVSPITFNNLTFVGNGATHTLTNPMTCTGLLTFGLTTAVVIVNGSSINTSGGLRFGGTSGNVTGTTVVNVNGTQSMDCPSRTTGRLFLPLNLNAPNGTITVSSGCDALLGDLTIQPGTVIVTAADTRMKVCNAVAG